MTKIVINGYKGRMGQALLACIPNHQNIQVVGQVDVGDDIGLIIRSADVVVDFSASTATLSLVRQCANASKAMVIGTTGHSPEDRSDISEYIRDCNLQVVWAPNFSVGVNVLFHLVSHAARLLGPEFDLEITEAHHRHKKDAPSGTAKTLAQILAGVRDRQFGERGYPRQRGLTAYQSHGRQGETGERDCNQIGMHSIRGGSIAGDHTVLFAGDGECVELTHRASSRETFANGALLAAEWVVEQPPGLYSMEQVLGLI